MSRWHAKLDANLPGDLRTIAEWIRRVEELLARGLTFDPAQFSPEENFRRFQQHFDEHTVKEKLLSSSKMIGIRLFSERVC